MKLLENEVLAERIVSDVHGRDVVVCEYPPKAVIRGRALRILRRDAGLTIYALARATGLTSVQVAGVERGRYVPEDESEYRAAIMRAGFAQSGDT